MSMTPPTACSTPACGGHAVRGGKCENCQVEVEPAQRHDSHRQWKALYMTARWRKPVVGLRDTVLRRDPICKVCNRNPSKVADHVKDHRGNEKLFYDPKNLQGVCKDCHDQKTGSMHGKGDRKPAEIYMENGLIRDPEIN